MSSVDLSALVESIAQRTADVLEERAQAKRIDYLTPAQMAKRTGVSTKTLANWRSAKSGPKFEGGKGTGLPVRYPVPTDTPLIPK